jgi:hypothetical protein
MFFSYWRLEVTAMRSTTIPRAKGTARRASGSRAAHVLARAGPTARGIIYIGGCGVAMPMRAA